MGRLSSEGLDRTLGADAWLGRSETADLGCATRFGAALVAMPRILPPEALQRHWHGRYPAGAAADLQPGWALRRRAQSFSERRP